VMPPATYYTQPAVAYAGTQTERLEKIALQKWVALFFNGLEAWFDWRRTKMPAIIPGADNLNNNKVPVRYIYPLSEQALNSKNRLEAVASQVSDDLNTEIWIMK
ncbi:MAG: SusD/RagB family nutrient-binding outer membrane lipoprotein, partial [Chitinophagaceae bacterium]|nr:SusD/RagB family nutrient-binding outer membrane lipoprotein [Chitinophagaceae bacterium]